VVGPVQIAFALPPLLVNPGSKEGQEARVAIRKCAAEVGRAKMRPEGVVFTVGGAFHPRASKADNATILRALLDCLIELDVICLKTCPSIPGLYQTPVYYHLMPSQAPWETNVTLFRRGYGDCKSLVAARIAELRVRGKVAIPVFRHVKDNWGTMFHILILHGDGRWECPSRALGMHGVQEMPQHSMA